MAIAPGIYALMGAPGEVSPANLGRIANVAFVVGPRGVIVVETGVSFRHGEAIIAAVERITRRPIRLAIITAASQEIVFGALAFQARGIPVWMERSAAALMASRCEGCLDSLRAELGESAMAGTTLARPDRLIGKTRSLDIIGRPLLLIAIGGRDTPGSLALLDQRTGTLMAGRLASIDRIPDLRDVDGKGWSTVLATLERTRCMHLVPLFGRLGTCADLDALARYFSALDRRVREVYAAGVGLAELHARIHLVEFAAWEGYAAHHVANANRAYLRIERDTFNN